MQRGGTGVGRLTSVAWSRRVATNIGLGLLDVDSATPGIAVEVDAPDGPAGR